MKLFPLIGKETDFRLEILLLGACLANTPQRNELRPSREISFTHSEIAYPHALSKFFFFWSVTCIIKVDKQNPLISSCNLQCLLRLKSTSWLNLSIKHLIQTEIYQADHTKLHPFAKKLSHKALNLLIPCNLCSQ